MKRFLSVVLTAALAGCGGMMQAKPEAAPVQVPAPEPEPEPAPRSQQRGCCSVWNDGDCLREIVDAEGPDVEVEARRVWESCWYTTPGAWNPYLHYDEGDYWNFVWRPVHHHVLIYRGSDGGCRYHAWAHFLLDVVSRDGEGLLEGVPCPDGYRLPWRRGGARGPYDDDEMNGHWPAKCSDDYGH